MKIYSSILRPMDSKVIRPLALSCLMLLPAACEKIPSFSRLPKDAVILAFGDSLTYGTGASENKNYPELLARLTSLEVVNAGVPGEITANGVKRLPSWLDRYHPDLLILIHGGNDFLRKVPEDITLSNLAVMIDSARDRNIPVALFGVPRPGLLLSSAELYAVLADRNNVPIDTETLPEILGDRGLKSDAVHPNNKGYKLMAEAAYRLLQKHGAL